MGRSDLRGWVWGIIFLKSMKRRGKRVGREEERRGEGIATAERRGTLGDTEENKLEEPPVRVVGEGYSWLAASLWLGGGLTILVLAALMTVGPQRQVYLPGLSVPVPETCTLKSRFAIDCPGCGMTRSFIHLAHGRFLDAMRLNPASVLVFLFIAAQIPAAAARFLLGRRSRFAVGWARFNEIGLIALPSITFIQWVIRMSIGIYT